MKTLIRSFLLLYIIASVSFAQESIEKGTIKLAGGISYNSYWYDDENYKDHYDFSLNPQFYYFVTNNFSLGTYATYSYAKVYDRYTRTDIDLTPGISYYFNYRNIYPFVFCGAGYRSTYNDYSFNGTSKSWAYIIKFGCGLDFFISENISIEPYINYTTIVKTSTVKRNEVRIGIGIGNFIK
ncbi:MAG TPA: hypothetical protein DHW42_07100 [Candidatus Marinimicrobia bacterium]|nr:hypothetical protein [Candidatus Neomarinimicrobiota bacterium]